MSAQTQAEPQAVAVSPPNVRSGSLVVRVGQRFGVDPDLVYRTLIATAFRQRADRDTGAMREPSKEEMMALLIIAEQYNLNPFTRELYAFLDPKNGSIIPIVSVDGWLRIINSQTTLQSIEFNYSPETVEHKTHKCHEWIECVITRSDREKPVAVREYFSEVCRKVSYPTPWDTHPNRMHRHKAIIQCARVAFGFANIHDPDEGERIFDSTATRVPDMAPAVANINAQVSGAQPAALEHAAAESIPAVVGERQAEAQERRLQPQEAQKKRSGPAPIGDILEGASKTVAGGPPVTFKDVAEAINRAKSVEELDLARDLLRGVLDEAQRAELDVEERAKRKTLSK